MKKKIIGVLKTNQLDIIKVWSIINPKIDIFYVLFILSHMNQPLHRKFFIMGCGASKSSSTVINIPEGGFIPQLETFLPTEGFTNKKELGLMALTNIHEAKLSYLAQSVLVGELSEFLEQED